MAFGDTATLIDDFNRADEGPPVTDWTTLFGSGHEIISNELVGSIADTSVAGYDVDTYGPDVEAYFTFKSSQADQWADAVLMRMTTLTWATLDGYSAYHSRGASELRIYRIDNSVGTQLGAVVGGWEKSVDDKLGGSVVGNNIKCYVDDSGSWTEKLSRFDSTYAAAGYFGYRCQDAGSFRCAIDDFYGGTITEIIAQIFLPIRR